MKKIAALITLLISPTLSATVLDFEDVAASGGFTNYNTPSVYVEEGFKIDIRHGHVISAGYNPLGYNNHAADNGTDWLMLDNGGNNVLSALDSSLFSIQSVDVRTYGGIGVGTIIGTYANNSTVQVNVNYGLSLDTYSFGVNWTGLKSVNFTGSFSSKTLDNIVVNASVPEPAAFLLLGFGLFGLRLSRRNPRV